MSARIIELVVVVGYFSTALVAYALLRRVGRRDVAYLCGCMWPLMIPLMFHHRLQSGTWLPTKGPDAGRRYS